MARLAAVVAQTLRRAAVLCDMAHLHIREHENTANMQNHNAQLPHLKHPFLENEYAILTLFCARTSSVQPLRSKLDWSTYHTSALFQLTSVFPPPSTKGGSSESKMADGGESFPALSTASSKQVTPYVSK